MQLEAQPSWRGAMQMGGHQTVKLKGPLLGQHVKRTQTTRFFTSEGNVNDICFMDFTFLGGHSDSSNVWTLGDCAQWLYCLRRVCELWRLLCRGEHRKSEKNSKLGQEKICIRTRTGTFQYFFGFGSRTCAEQDVEFHGRCSWRGFIVVF